MVLQTLTLPLRFHIRRVGLNDDQVCTKYGVSPAKFRFRINATGVDVQVRRTGKYHPSART
jgi:hypothetical protein